MTTYKTSTGTVSGTAITPWTTTAASNGILFTSINPILSIYPLYSNYVYTWLATGSSATLSFFFRQDVGGWMLDDVTVYHNLIQLITNGGFETGDRTGWNYSGLCGSRLSNVASGFLSSKTGSYYYYGTCTNGMDCISQTFATVMGDAYVISFWLTNYLFGLPTEIVNVTIN